MRVRIALLSPYSWTYPGGVTRHVEALAAELASVGHEPRILAPFDPDDRLSRQLHRGARPQPLQAPEDFVSLGRTIGIPANGAVSNLSLSPESVFALRAELRGGGYDVLHVHEPVVPVLGWDALLSAEGLPVVGTFHTFSENVLTNGIAAVGLGGRRRMNRLHVRIAVSEAAAWTARRFYGGRYRIIPNGVQLLDSPRPHGVAERQGGERPLRILFIGAAVERKGLPVLLRAFEALREQLPATLTIVGASAEEVDHLMLDGRGVEVLGKVSEERKRSELARAEVLCAPSLHGESFGMVLTEAFAAATPVLASDIPGYRDVVRGGIDGLLVPAGDALALAESLRTLAFDERLRARMSLAARERAQRFAWPNVAAEVLGCYEDALRVGAPASLLGRFAARHGLTPADMRPRIPAERISRLPNSSPPLVGRARRRRSLRRAGLALSSLIAGGLAGLALQRVGVTRVVASLLASKPGLVAAAVGVMCAAMFARAIAWHSILSRAPVWRRVKRRDAMQGTFIGVLMSATLPARLGEPSRALIVARRIGHARETLPLVTGTIVSQTLLNLLALGVLAGVSVSGMSALDDHDRALLVVALAPIAALGALALAPVLLAPISVSRARLTPAVQGMLGRLREALRVFAHPRAAASAAVCQLGAWALQWLACLLLLLALGVHVRAGDWAAAAGVLFAVNVTALIPATPANVGVFQAACVAVLSGTYHVSLPEAIAFGIVLQLVELATALIMGLPALVNEGFSWREVRRRAMHASLVKLGPLPAALGASATRSSAKA
jgi:phosphatidyl-myo-inositol alpha-mannosyltransferase